MSKLTWLLLMFVLVACSASGNVTPTASPVPSSTPAPTGTSTAMPTATNTPIAGAPIERCVEILLDFPENDVPPWTLVVRVLTKGISLVNFQQQTQRSIPGYFDDVGTSPDGKWLSYIIYINDDNDEAYMYSVTRK